MKSLVTLVTTIIVTIGSVFGMHHTDITNYASSSADSNNKQAIVSTSSPIIVNTTNSNAYDSGISLKTFDSSSIPFQSYSFSFQYPSDWQISNPSSSGATLSKGKSKINITLNNDGPGGIEQYLGNKTGSKNINGKIVDYFVQNPTNKPSGLTIVTYYNTSPYTNRKSMLFSLSTYSTNEISVLENIIASFKITPVPKTAGHITISDPNTATIVQKGHSYSIVWSGEKPNPIITYSLYVYVPIGESLVKTYLGHTSSNQQNFTFTPATDFPPSNQYKVYILDESGNIMATSQQFTIK